MLSFAADFWPVFWAIIGTGAALSVLVTLGIAAGWPRERKADATLVQLAAAYHIAADRDREHAHAA
jgi:hypothetical protein